jgi:hypothetical protein
VESVKVTLVEQRSHRASVTKEIFPGVEPNEAQIAIGELNEDYEGRTRPGRSGGKNAYTSMLTSCKGIMEKGVPYVIDDSWKNRILFDDGSQAMARRLDVSDSNAPMQCTQSWKCDATIYIFQAEGSAEVEPEARRQRCETDKHPKAEGRWTKKQRTEHDAHVANSSLLPTISGR